MLLDDGKNIYAVIVGIFLGFINGFLGGGGGTLAVIALLAFYNLEQKQAHATALLVILPVTVVSVVAYIVAGGVDYALAAVVSLGVSAGGFFGSKLLGKFSNNAIKFFFACLTLAVGVRMLFK